MIGVYLSGTGNTKHCIEKLVKLLDQSLKRGLTSFHIYLVCLANGCGFITKQVIIRIN